MQTVVYADVLVAVNIFITYILLVSVRVITKNGTKKYGVLIASLIGGFSSLIIFCENLPISVSIFYKIAVGVLVTVFAFHPENKKIFFKVLSTFLLVSFLFGGIMYFFEITFSPNKVFFINGTVYFDISVLFLVSATLIIYGLLVLFDYFFKKKTVEKTTFTATIFFRDEEVTVKALYDTGNFLTDGLEGKPVNIAFIDSIAALFTFNEIKFLKFGKITDEVPETLKKYLRVIPCSAVTGETVLFAIVPEKIIIKNDKFQYITDFSVLAVTNKNTADGEFNCILNSDIFERGKTINVEKIKK